MKLNVSPVSFKASLLISNADKIRGIGKSITPLTKEFSAATSDEEYIMIMNISKDNPRDKFELHNKDGEQIAKYSYPLSRQIKQSSMKSLTKKLIDIYEIMKIKSCFNSVIELLRSQKKIYAKAIEEAQQDNSLTREEKNETIARNKMFVKFCNKDISYQERACKVECDTYALAHGLSENEE